MKISKSLFIIIFLITISPISQANDGVFNGQGSQLIPVKETNIKMLSENINIKQLPKYTGYEFNAQFNFENPTDKEITLTIGFPEWECMGDCSSKDKWTLNQFTTLVRNQKVTTTIKPGVPNKNFNNSGRVHSFNVTFKPKEKVTVKHHYNMKPSGSVEGKEIHYLTRSGSLWNGPIGKATFTVHLNKFPQSFAYPSSYHLKSYKRDPINTGKGATVIFEQNNWVPKEDLHIHYDMINYSAFMPHDCPFPGRMADASTKTHVAELSQNTRNHCRNAIYATYGYPFKNKKWTETFYKKSKTARAPSPFQLNATSKPDSTDKSWTLRFMEINPKFQNSSLSKEDLSLIDALRMK